MKRLFGKYVVFELSLLLILSNFSYATQLMFCQMSNDSNACECIHNSGKQYDGISLTKEKTKCCSEETSELTNFNVLTTVKTELPQDVNSFGALILNLNQNSDLLTSSCLNVIIDKSHLPKLDIPVLTSSLLI